MYTITANAEFNHLEVAFDCKPSEAVRDALKAHKFRWHAKRHVWYGRAEESTIRSALDAAGQQQTDAPAATSENHSAPAAPRAKVDADLLRAQYAMVWSSAHMVDYLAGKVAALAELPGGELIPVEKKQIETHFCFGESGYDYDDAADMAQHARTSSGYFKRENMKYYTREIDELTEAMTEESHKCLVIYTDGTYTAQPAECRLRDCAVVRLADVLDVTGPAFISELPGKEINIHGRNARVATAEEARIILDAWRAAAAAHEKKVDAYLKRYGLSKVHSWTYWRDA